MSSNNWRDFLLMKKAIIPLLFSCLASWY